MPRRATGTIEPHQWADGRTVTFRLKVRADGKRYTISLGTNHEGWSIERAQVELEQIMRQIERGTWEPPTMRAVAPNDLDHDETVRVTAYRWWQRRKTELAVNTELDYKWRLDHALRHLGNDVTAELDARRCRRLSPAARRPGPLAAVGQHGSRPARPDPRRRGRIRAARREPRARRRRRMKVPKSSRTFLEPDMVVDLLDAAGAWERELPEHQRYGRRAFLAPLCLAGPRISEPIDSPTRTARPARGRAACSASEDRGRHRPDVGADRVPARRAARPSGGRAIACVSPMEPASRSSRPGRAAA